MSKIGEKPISTEGVDVVILQNKVTVKSGDSELNIMLPHGIVAKNEDGNITVGKVSLHKQTRALHGLTRSLIANAVSGVQKPWKKTLKVVGTGYRVKQQGEELIFEVGYSHSVTFGKTEGITLTVHGQDTIEVSGADRQKVGQVAFKIRSIKKPDPYKGKGIRYENEMLRLKPGKKSKVD